ncbi:putative glucan endo-1,3-beta-glucosidase eglC [Glarea lozoyensis 74030]|uniref:Probable glucan endo-1,3-beta-glucosidase eglC n=1 Tax=Glarea lozoyensis (strain ATCC 74030 / MF5533) TaxID=1104152 RepID=H0ERX7_GLAL7|nr:putative glucan endo-1,3-beta-glucosidase eglC [Glarea lozoyensis 74030]
MGPARVNVHGGLFGCGDSRGKISMALTFVDQESKKYRHALLVNPVAGDTFKAVPVHAGGMAWYGNTLWVVDSSGGDGAVGFRVFDLSNIWTMDSGGDTVMGKSGSSYYAMGYNLLVGEYQVADATAPRRLARWDLDYTTRKLKTSAGIASASWAYCVDIDRMQGAVSNAGKVYISRSNGDSNGDLWAWTPGNAAKNNAGFFPPSPEDLSWDTRTDTFYGLTEAKNKRYILTYKKSQVSVWKTERRATATAQEKIYQGFNSGNTFTDQTAKKQADFEKEFKTASALSFSPGSFNTLASTALSGKPVGHVDSWSAWANESNSAVVDAADFVGTDLYPYYEKDLTNTIDNAKTIFDTLLKNVTDSAGNKSVWITETGWPVSGPNFGSAVPSVDNARAYWERIGCQLFGRMNVWWYNLRDS